MQPIKKRERGDYQNSKGFEWRSRYLEKIYATFLGAKVGDRAITLAPGYVNCCDLIKLIPYVDRQAYSSVTTSVMEVQSSTSTTYENTWVHCPFVELPLFASSGPSCLAHVESSPGVFALLVQLFHQ